MARLTELRALLVAKDDMSEKLTEQLDKAIVERANWLNDYQKGNFLDPELILPKVETRGLLQQMIGFGGLPKRQPDPAKDKK
jgi:hypothetical protein